MAVKRNRVALAGAVIRKNASADSAIAAAMRAALDQEGGR